MRILACTVLIIHLAAGAACYAQTFNDLQVRLGAYTLTRTVARNRSVSGGAQARWSSGSQWRARFPSRETCEAWRRELAVGDLS